MFVLYSFEMKEKYGFGNRLEFLSFKIIKVS